MATDIEALCKILTEERFKQLLLSLHGTQHTEIESEPNEKVNKENMATYASVVSKEHYTETRHNEQSTSTDSHTQDTHRNPSDFVKPIFSKDQDVHESVKPP
jgi:hypothetical protein